jgi:hypothetical protein
MSVRRWFLTFLATSFALTALVQLAPLLAGPSTQEAKNQEPRGAKTATPLPAGAIARLGTPVQLFYKLYAIYVTFLPDGRTAATGGPNKKLAFWDARTGKAIRSLDGERFVEVSPDGKILASKTSIRDTNVRLMDLVTEKEIGKLAGGEGGRIFCFSADGRYLAIGGSTANHRPDDPPLRVWEVATGQILRTFPVQDTLMALAFSPDGKLLVTAKSQNLPPRLQIWDVSSGKLHRSFKFANGDGSFLALRVSPDGTLLAAAARQPRAWELATGKEVWHIYRLGQDAVALDVIFSPNGQMVALGTTKGNVVLVESTTGRERARFDGAAQYIVGCVAFSPCGMMVASAGGDCAPLVWDVTGLINPSIGRPLALSANELDEHWDDLRREDAAKAWHAILALAARPAQAVPLLKERLAYRKSMLAPKRLGELLADLDSDAFATREAAGKLLKNLGPGVSPALKKLCAGTTSIEARRRAEDILGQIAKSGLVSEPMLEGRVLEVLEYSASPAARELLQAEARGAPASPLARNAKAALDRIAKRPAP